MQFQAPTESLSALIKKIETVSDKNRIITAHGKGVDDDDDRHQIPAGETLDQTLLCEMALDWGLRDGKPVTLKLSQINPDREEGDISTGWRYVCQAKIGKGSVAGVWSGSEPDDLLGLVVHNVMKDPAGNAAKLEIVAPYVANAMEHAARGLGSFVREFRRAISDTPLPPRVVYVQQPALIAAHTMAS